MGKVIRVSMLDIAKRAGVSQATVSLALRGHRSLPLATRERIAKLARKMGYAPQGAISTLMARVRLRRPLTSRESLAAITFWRDHKELSDREKYSYRAFYDGAKIRAAALGYTLTDVGMAAPGMTPRRASDILSSRGIEGAIVFPVTTADPLPLDWDNLAAATVGYTLQWPPLHRAAADQYEAVIMALRNLRARGYERIGLAVDAVTNERLKRRWLAAFCAHQFASGRMPRDAAVVLAGEREQAFAAWVRRYRPDAVLFGHVPAPDWAANLGLKVPGDLGLVGLSPVYRDRHCAHIDERSDLVGAAAVDLVVAQLHRNERGIPSCQHELFIVGRWVDGASVRPPKDTILRR